MKSEVSQASASWRAALQPRSHRSLARQVAGMLRAAVLQGQLRPGARVPSTRALSTELGVSRNTVLEAYAQLLSEGYFEGRVGSGTFISRALLEDLFAHRTNAHSSAGGNRQLAAMLSRRGMDSVSASASVSDDQLRPFTPGIPALEPELFEGWWRVATRRHRRVTSEMLNYGHATGYLPLREAIAAYLGPARGVRCAAAQVIVTAGTQQALALTARLLLEPGDQVWIEEPGYAGARGALLAAGARLVPIPVDDDGLKIDRALQRAPNARLAYVSPSHQYPLGVTMTLPRRLQLLGWAARSKAWILEDDYDAEFRYGGRPMPSLQGLDRADRVLYIGTFSKVLFPSLRLGYIIVPEDLVDAYARANAVSGHRTPTIDQAVLADFIANGHFSRHLRRMRHRYEQSRATLEAEARRMLGSALTVTGSPIGMHLVGRLARGIDDRAVSRRAAARGVCVPPLADYYLDKPRLSGLVLGYGHLTDQAIRVGVEQLASALD